MNRYDSYKDSGVEWIGEIPSNWEKSRIRMVGNLYGGLTGKKGRDFNDEDNPSNKPFVPFTNIFNNTYISKDHFQYVNVEENENQNRVLKNDLFFLMSSESYEDLGKSSILLEDVEELYLNSFCKGFRIKDSKVYPLFLNYQLLGSLHKEMISVEGNGFTRINLRQDRLLDIPIFIPPLSEQQQIVSFLDTKTTLIDSLIEKTQQKIELLKEKRTSLINEVVTKGLNPNVEMKESGVEWIGKIPSHWDFIRLKYLFSLEGGKDPKNIQNDDGEYPILGTGGEISRGSDYLYDKPTLLLGRKGTIDKPYLYESPFWVSDVMYYTIMKKDITPRYLNFLFKTIPFDYYRYGSTQPSMSRLDYESMYFPIPPSDERQEISNYIDEQTGLIDNTVSIEEKRIELLKEYRQSLISEVVTGKRKIV